MQLYFPQHTPAHKAATDMKELSIKLISESSGACIAQLEAAAAQAPAPAAQPSNMMLAGAYAHDVPSLTHMSAVGSDWLTQSLVNSFFPANSFHFSHPAEASLFSLLMSQQVRPYSTLLPANTHPRRRISACFPLQPLLLLAPLPWGKVLSI